MGHGQSLGGWPGGSLRTSLGNRGGGSDRVQGRLYVAWLVLSEFKVPYTSLQKEKLGGTRKQRIRHTVHKTVLWLT